jgi:hypothetical protein
MERIRGVKKLSLMLMGVLALYPSIPLQGHPPYGDKTTGGLGKIRGKREELIEGITGCSRMLPHPLHERGGHSHHW